VEGKQEVMVVRVVEALGVEVEEQVRASVVDVVVRVTEVEVAGGWVEVACWVVEGVGMVVVLELVRGRVVVEVAVLSGGWATAVGDLKVEEEVVVRDQAVEVMG
jgi:hypothetical protein